MNIQGFVATYGSHHYIIGLLSTSDDFRTNPLHNVHFQILPAIETGVVTGIQFYQHDFQYNAVSL